MAAKKKPEIRKTCTTLGDLTPDPKNARKHNPRNVGSIVNSLHAVGAARSIVIDEDNVVLAGNGMVEAAGQAGIENVKVVEADGNTIVAVRRTGLTPKQKAQLAIYDNRTAELADWDMPVLTSLAEDVGLDLKDLDFTIDEIGKLDAEFLRGQGVIEDDVPDAADVPKRCNDGDLWTLGNHRLLCGDSTKAENVTRLLAGAVPFMMVTDPPYGVEYTPDWRNDAFADGSDRRTGEVQNDARVDWTESYKLFPGRVAYVWHADRFAADLVVNLRDADFEIRTQIIWRKPRFVVSRGHYHWQHEPAWYAVRKGIGGDGGAKWCGDRSQSTIWDIEQKDGGEDTNHGTQKPVECMARPIRNHGGKEDDVYDPFCGSGTTIIAAEQLGRCCYAIELSPMYCDVILARWEKLTGKKAERVEEEG